VLINRILIVGYGSIGKRHLRLARELLPRADIRLLRHQVCADVPEHANGCFHDLSSALKFEPQLAVVANPAPFHLQVALPLAEQGVHLLIEKPLSVSSAEVSRLIEVCESRQCILMTGYNLRFLPSLTRFRDLVRSGELAGKVASVRCEIGQYLPTWRQGVDYRKGVSARNDLGGGALLELSHEIDYLCWIFGRVDWVSASLLRQGNLDIDVEDSAHLLLGFEPTADGHQLVASLNIDFIRHDTTRSCIAIGAEGSLRWNALTGCVDFFARGATSWQTIYTHTPQRDESYLAEWKHLLGLIKHRETPLVGGEDGLRVMEVIDAARKASDSFGRERIVLGKP
jgi:predicted dehydrogenase